jgi:ADP-ribose pyrophosphatase
MKKTLPAGAALIPDNAQKVFTGEIFDVYQWPQPMFDGSTQTFEMLKRPDTVQVIAVRGEEVLLVDEEQPGRTPRLHFPGGRTDKTDESWRAAAQRELLEETGITCANWRLIDANQPIIKIEWFAPVFLATEVISQVDQKLDSGGERISLQWMPFADMRRQVLAGLEPTMQYLTPLLSRVQSAADLLALPEFQGTAVER